MRAIIEKCHSKLMTGDRVFIYRVVHEGKKEIDDRWEYDVYVVNHRIAEAVPVYVTELTWTCDVVKAHQYTLLLKEIRVLLKYKTWSWI